MNKSALRKTVFLLICTVLMITCIGGAVAVDSPVQSSSSLATSSDQSSSPLATSAVQSSSSLATSAVQSSSPLATAAQVQAGFISANSGDVSYGLGQQQYASIINGDGTITQNQVSYSNANLNGPVTAINVKEIGVQNVDLASSYGSTDNTVTGSIDNSDPKVKEKFSIPIGGSDNIAASQFQSELSSGDISQEQIAVLKIKENPNKIKASISLKQK
jgi:hypothetical protein